jgi:hypothetical protein
MRAMTLSLDDDVAVLLEQAQEQRQQSRAALVNEVLRRGLGFLTRRPKRAKKPYRMKPVSVGRCYLESLDNVAEVLATAGGASRRWRLKF